MHLTCVFNCPNGVIDVYTNGVLAGTFSGVTDPLSSVGNQFAYIGRSLYTADSYLDWTIDELRIYNGALESAEVAATDALGPNQLLTTNPPEIGLSASGGNLTLTWPLASAGYSALTTTNLASGIWTPTSLTPQIIAGQWQFTIPTTNNSAQYYQLVK